MTRDEFLTELDQELATTGLYEFNRGQISYYRDYIDGEMAKGRSEKDVMDELGDPRLIAKTIKTANGFDDDRPVEADDQGQPQSGPQEEQNGYDREPGKVRGFSMTGAKVGWILAGILLVVLLLVVAFISLLGNIFAFSPLLFVLLILLWYRGMAGRYR